ncbi:MAG TPA: chlorite dismutase family protein [Burkholderiales bacterium]|nr:chlorite dismutase family protein [Burkholderiales bacterium]
MLSNQRLFVFAGGESGGWRVARMAAIAGTPLEAVPRIEILGAGQVSNRPVGCRWMLHGVASNERYVTRPEKVDLSARQPALGRPDAERAALIAIRKSERWWALAQDERREIFEERSRHVRIGMKHLPAVARRLHHCRDLATAEPFDFLTWFEYPAAHAAAFDDLVAELRATEEWRYVEREVDLRLQRE